MKTKLNIFSPEKLKIFFINFDRFFDVTIKNLNELEPLCNSKIFSIVFFDDQKITQEHVLKKILNNENFMIVSKEFNELEKTSSGFKSSLVTPISVSKFLDKANEFINKKTHLFKNIALNSNIVTNTKTKDQIYLTQAEKVILSKLLNEKTVSKKLLEREALHIKQDLNTSSVESHLNRIRKKLKKINSNFSIVSKHNNVFLETFNQDK